MRRFGLHRWSVFEGHARPIVEEYVALHGHSPGAGILKNLGFNWLICAAYDHHGGWRQSLKRMGFPVAVAPARNIFGHLAEWPIFKTVAIPIWDDCLRQHHHLPTKRWLIKRKLYPILHAIRNHHGGFLCVHQRLGYERTQMRRNGPPYSADWHNFEYRAGYFRKHWPILVAQGIGPSGESLRGPGRGLIRFARTNAGGWAGLLHEHGLILHRRGQIELRLIRDIIAALDFFEHHRRWPRPEEDSRYQQRRAVYRDQAWEKFVRRTDLNPMLLDQLIERWERHSRWCQRHQLNRIPACREHINRLIIARAHHPILSRASR